MSSSALESYYCTFNYSSLNCSGFNYRAKVHITTESSASLIYFGAKLMRDGLMFVWGEIREGSAVHVTGSEL